VHSKRRLSHISLDKETKEVCAVVRRFTGCKKQPDDVPGLTGSQHILSMTTMPVYLEIYSIKPVYANPKMSL